MTASAPPDPHAVVLIVEDEPVQRMMAADMAEAAGFTVLEACDADDAVRILASRDDVRLVLTDIDMPGALDGVGLAAAIRERWPPVGIILTSGRVTPAAASLPARAVFLPKPFRPREVVAEMRRMAG